MFAAAFLSFLLLVSSLLLPAAVFAVVTAPSQQNDQVPSTTGSCSVVSSGFQPGLWFNEDAIGRTNFAHVTNIESPSWNLGKAGAMDGFKVILCLTGSSDSPKYDLFRQNLATLGFATTESCDFAGQLTAAAFNVAVMIDTACDGGGTPLSDADVSAFVAFFESGRGAYVLADNCPCFANANKILAAVQAPLSGLVLRGNDGLSPTSMDYGNPLVPGEFGNHPVFTGVPHMSTGDTLSAPYVDGVADAVGSFGVLATVSCSSLVLCSHTTVAMTSHPSLLYVDPPVLFPRGSAASKWGRMVVDMALTRFFDSNFGANRYGANAVVWLSDPDRYYRGLVVYQDLPDSIKHGLMVEGCFTGDSFTIAFNATTPATRAAVPSISFVPAAYGSASAASWVPRCLMVEHVASCPAAPLSCAKCYVDLHGGQPGHFTILVDGLNSTVGFVVQPASLIPRATLVSWTGSCRANADRTSVEACSDGDQLTISWTLPNPTTMSFAGSNGALACAALSISGTQLTCTLGPTAAAVPNGAYSIEIQGVPTGITFGVDAGCRRVANRYLYCRHGDTLHLAGSTASGIVPSIAFVPTGAAMAVATPGCLAVHNGNCNSSGICDAACVLDLTFVDVAEPTAWLIEVNGDRQVTDTAELLVDVASLTLANGLASVAPFASSWTCGAVLVGSTVTGCVSPDLVRTTFDTATAIELSTGTALVSLFPSGGAVDLVTVDRVSGAAVLRISGTDGIVGPGLSGNFALMLNGTTTGLAVPRPASVDNSSTTPTAPIPAAWSVVPLSVGGNTTTRQPCICSDDDDDDGDAGDVCDGQLSCAVARPTQRRLCAWVLVVSTRSFNASALTFVAASKSDGTAPHQNESLRCAVVRPVVVRRGAGLDDAPWSSAAECFLESSSSASSDLDVAFALVAGAGNFTGLTIRIHAEEPSGKPIADQCPAPGSVPPPLPANSTAAVPAAIVRHAVNRSTAAAGRIVKHLRNVSNGGSGSGEPPGTWPWGGGGGAWWPGWYDYVCWWDTQWYACVWGGGGSEPGWWPWPNGGGGDGIPSSWWWPGGSGGSSISGGWVYPSSDGGGGGGGGGGGSGSWSGGSGGFSPSAGGGALAPGSTTDGTGTGGTGTQNGPQGGGATSAGATVNVLPAPPSGGGGGAGPGSAGGLSPGFWRHTAAAAGAAAGGSCAVILFAADGAAACRALVIWEAFPAACGEGVAGAATAPSSAFINTSVGRNLSPLNPPRVNLSDVRTVAAAATPLGATLRKFDSCNPAASDSPFVPIPASSVPSTHGSQGTVVPPGSPGGLPATRVVVIVIPPPVPNPPPPPPPPPPHASANVSCALRGGANDTTEVACRLCLTDGACNATNATECDDVPLIPVRPATVANVCHHAGFVPAPPPTVPPTMTTATVPPTTALTPTTTTTTTTGSPPLPTTTTPAPTQPTHHHHAAPGACANVPVGAQMCVLPTLDCYVLPYSLLASCVITGVVAVAGFVATLWFNNRKPRDDAGVTLARRALAAFAVLCVCLQDAAAVGALSPRFVGLDASATPSIVLRRLAAVVGQDPNRLGRCLTNNNATDVGRGDFTVASGTGTFLAVSIATVVAAGAAMLVIARLVGRSSVGGSDAADDGAPVAPVEDDLQSNLMGTVQDGDEQDDSMRRDAVTASSCPGGGVPAASSGRSLYHHQHASGPVPEQNTLLHSAAECWGIGQLAGLTVLALLQCTPAVALLLRAAVWMVACTVAAIHARRAGHPLGPSCVSAVPFALLAGASAMMAFAASTAGADEAHVTLASIGLLVYVGTAIFAVASNLVWRPVADEAASASAGHRCRGSDTFVHWLAIAAAPCVFMAAVLLPGLELAHAGALLLVLFAWAAASVVTLLLPRRVSSWSPSSSTLEVRSQL